MDRVMRSQREDGRRRAVRGPQTTVGERMGRDWPLAPKIGERSGRPTVDDLKHGPYRRPTIARAPIGRSRAMICRATVAKTRFAMRTPIWSLDRVTAPRR